MATGGIKDAYIAFQSKISIRNAGAENIVQAIMDIANKATCPIIIKEFPWIICAWCTAHFLCLEDISKMAFLTIFGAKKRMLFFWIGGRQAFAAKLSMLTPDTLIAE